MSSFVPRSVGRDNNNPRGGYSGNTRGGRDYHGGFSRGGGRNRDKGLFDPPSPNPSRGGRERGKFIPIRPLMETRRSPVKILHPDDPRHPDFLKDPRNQEKRKQLEDQEKRKHLDDRRSERHAPSNSQDHPVDETLYSDIDDGDTILSKDKFSEEGLRITVENKGGAPIADPTFYDEIQPQDRSQSRRSLSPRSGQNLAQLDIPSSASTDESIRITVGNERYKEKDVGRKSSPHRDSRAHGSSADKESSKKSSGSRPSDRNDSKSRRGEEHDRGDRHSKRPHSRSHSRDRQHRRGSSRERRRSRSRDRRRSRSREPQRSRNHGGEQKRSRSKEKQHSQSSREGHKSPNRKQDKPGPSRSGGRNRKHSRSRSLDSISDDSLSSRSSSGSRSSSTSSRSTNVQPPTDNQGRDKDRKPETIRSEGTSGAQQQGKGKDNPFMDFLNDLDYKKLAGEADNGNVNKEPQNLPWLSDLKKVPDMKDVERYLESKMRQVAPDTRRVDPGNPVPDLARKEIPKPFNEGSLTKPPAENSPYSTHSSLITPRSKDRSPFDIYDDLPEQGKLPEKRATPPPVETKPKKSILKKSGVAPSPQDKSTIESLDGSDIYGYPQMDNLPGLSSTTTPTAYTLPATQSSVVPEIGNLMNIEDEDEFLYGDTSSKTVEPDPPPEPVRQQETLASVHRSVFTGGYQGVDPGWDEAPRNKDNVTEDTDPVEDETPKSGLKPETDKAPVDPTIQNILKSIGFNFELSKLMQEKAEKERKKQEGMESYGIKQGSSFMSGGLKGTDIRAVLNQEEAQSADKRKNSIEQRKESYEERARRYREEQERLYRAERGIPEPPTANSYQEQTEQPMYHSENSQQSMEANNQLQGLQQLQSYGHLDDPYSRQQGFTEYYEGDHQGGGYPPNQPIVDYQGDYMYQQQQQQFAPPASSNLTVIQTVESGDPTDPSISGLKQLQDDYHDGDYSRVQRESTGYGTERYPEREHRRMQSSRRDDLERAEYDRRESYESQETHVRRYDSPHGSNSSYDRYKADRNSPRSMDRSDDHFESTRDGSSRRESYEKGIEVGSRRPENRDREPPIHERDYRREPSPVSKSSSRRTVLPPKSETLMKIENRPQTKVQDEPIEKRTIAIKPAEKTSKKNSDKSDTDKLTKSVKPVSKMSSKEREGLIIEIEERRKRLKALEKELLRLRKQENEMMRKKQRQKDGHKDQLLLQNTELQEEIAQQISVLKKAAEVNCKLLAASRTADERDVDFLAMLTKEEDPNEEQTRRRKKSPSPPPAQEMDPGKARSEKSHEKSSHEKSSLVKVKEEKSVTQEKVKLKKIAINYEYFDPGNHWCKLCNHVCSNVYEAFQHLQSKKHTGKLDPYDRPWMPDSLKNPTKVKKGQSVAAPLKGVEFMMSTQAIYCSLCNIFSGDMMCAEEHMKSQEHNAKYQKFIDENTFYERRRNLDKAAGLSLLGAGGDKPNKKEDKKDRESDRTRKRERDSSTDRERSKDRSRSRERSKDRSRSRERSKGRGRSRDRSRDRDRRREIPRKAHHDSDDDKYSSSKKWKKDRMLEMDKVEASKRKTDSVDDEKYGKKIRHSEERNPDMGKNKDAEDVQKKDSSKSYPATQDKKPEVKTFKQFSWQKPMIGKAPGYKKAQLAKAQAEQARSKAQQAKAKSVQAARAAEEKISLMLAGNVHVAKNTVNPLTAAKKDGPKPRIALPNEPAFLSRKNAPKVSDPDPLELFLTVGGSSSTTGTTLPTKDGTAHEHQFQSVVASAFSGQGSDPIQEEMQEEAAKANLQTLPETIPLPLSEIPSPRGPKPKILTKEEQADLKMLGIEESTPSVIPVKPPQLAMTAQKPATSMASSTANKLYDIFFAEKTPKKSTSTSVTSTAANKLYDSFFAGKSPKKSTSLASTEALVSSIRSELNEKKNVPTNDNDIKTECESIDTTKKTSS